MPKAIQRASPLYYGFSQFSDLSTLNIALETMVKLMEDIMKEIENLKGEYKTETIFY